MKTKLPSKKSRIAIVTVVLVVVVGVSAYLYFLKSYQSTNRENSQPKKEELTLEQMYKDVLYTGVPLKQNRLDSVTVAQVRESMVYETPYKCYLFTELFKEDKHSYRYFGNWLKEKEAKSQLEGFRKYYDEYVKKYGFTKDTLAFNDGKYFVSRKKHDDGEIEYSNYKGGLKGILDVRYRHYFLEKDNKIILLYVASSIRDVNGLVGNENDEYHIELDVFMSEPIDKDVLIRDAYKFEDGKNYPCND